MTKSQTAWPKYLVYSFIEHMHTLKHLCAAICIHVWLVRLLRYLRGMRKYNDWNM